MNIDNNTLNAKNSVINRRHGGFSLIELIVVVVIFMAISAAVIVNWSSFMRYQELREDALTFHKDIMAQKAKALENNAKVEIEYEDNKYTIVEYVKNANGDDVEDKRIERLLRDKIGITTATASTILFTGGNNWSSKIVVSPTSPDAINAYQNGGVVVSASNSGKQFCIAVNTDENIKPELYYRNGTSGTWVKM